MTSTQLNLPSKSLPVESAKLDILPLEDIAKGLENGLKKNFRHASVTVVQCPDLTQSPWGLAASGLGGNTRLLDVGGVPYLMPTVTRDKLYDMKDYPELTSDKADTSGLVIGAGAGPWPFINRNAEMMPNLYVNKDKTVLQETRITRTHDEDGSYSTIKLPETETRNALLGNLFISDGEPGEVLKIDCRERIGEKNFVTCMREILAETWPELAIGLGGVFNIGEGKAKFHVMPDFSPCPINTNEDVNNWLKFYEVSSPLTVLSVFISRDPDLDLRVEHSHGWGLDGKQGGHYHYDTTPECVQYTGYYNLAQAVYRIDRPVETHQVGRD